MTLYQTGLNFCEASGWIIPMSMILLCCTLMTCISPDRDTKTATKPEVAVRKIEKHGHRGARGLLPENTIPAMIKAMELGVDALEFDVVISGDRQVVVSHEAFMSHETCLDPKGNSIPEADEKNHNIYQMDYATVKSYDCGMQPHPNFPDQQKVAAHKPRLADLIDQLDHWALEHDVRPPFFSIEVKSSTEAVGISQPPAAEFSRLVIEVLRDKGVIGRSNIQSFDINVLEACKEQAPELALVYLIRSDPDFRANMEKISFVPNTYGPDFKLVNAELIAYAKEVGMKVIPWTVNEESDIKRLVDLGVDGLVSDYPDRLHRLLP